MKVSITEKQLKRVKSKVIYESVLDNMVFKLSLITEDGKTEPDMEWDFTNVKKDIDKSKSWIKTQEDALEYVEKLGDYIKNLPKNVKRKIIRYVVISLIGLLTASQIEKKLTKPFEKIVSKEKELTEPIFFNIKKSSKKLINHLKNEEGSIKHKGEPVLTVYDLGDGAYTVGYGHAIFPDEEEGFEFLPSYSNIEPNITTITKENAETLLKDDIREAESIINRILDEWEQKGIVLPITQGMYDAMVSMAYNMGPKIRKSDFIQTLKRGDIEGAKELILTTTEHLFDDYPGLKSRREKEYKMFI